MFFNINVMFRSTAIEAITMLIKSLPELYFPIIYSKITINHYRLKKKICLLYSPSLFGDLVQKYMADRT